MVAHFAHCCNDCPRCPHCNKPKQSYVDVVNHMSREHNVSKKFLPEEIRVPYKKELEAIRLSRRFGDKVSDLEASLVTPGKSLAHVHCSSCNASIHKRELRSHLKTYHNVTESELRTLVSVYDGSRLSHGAPLDDMMFEASYEKWRDDADERFAQDFEHEEVAAFAHDFEHEEVATCHLRSVLYFCISIIL